MGYPDAQAEFDMIDNHGGISPLEFMDPVADARVVNKLIEAVRAVHVSSAVKKYVIDIIAATRASSELRLGGSPRATLHLIRTGRAAAALDGRDYVLPDDIQTLAEPVLAHRLLTTAEAQIGRRTAAAILRDILKRIPLPAGP
jgi:MoxR-like ATPase